jgi:hypothetical protein
MGFDSKAVKNTRLAFPHPPQIIKLDPLDDELNAFYNLMRACDAAAVQQMLFSSENRFGLAAGGQSGSALNYILNISYLDPQKTILTAQALFPFTDGLERAANGHTLLQTVKRAGRGPEIEQAVRAFMQWEIEDRKAPLKIAENGDLVPGSRIILPSAALLGENRLILPPSAPTGPSR